MQLKISNKVFVNHSYQINGFQELNFKHFRIHTEIFNSYPDKVEHSKRANKDNVE